MSELSCNKNSIYKRVEEIERQLDKLDSNCLDLFSRIKCVENLLIVAGISLITIAVLRGLS